MITIEPLDEVPARPVRTTMQRQPDGSLFLSNAGLGKAVIVDPGKSFSVRSTVAYPTPVDPAGQPSSKATLSHDGATVYVVGSSKGSGLAAYDASTGALKTTFDGDRIHSAIYELASGTLLGITADSPRLSFFDPSLTPLGTADTDLTVMEVY